MWKKPITHCVLGCDVSFARTYHFYRNGRSLCTGESEPIFSKDASSRPFFSCPDCVALLEKGFLQPQVDNLGAAYIKRDVPLHICELASSCDCRPSCCHHKIPHPPRKAYGWKSFCDEAPRGCGFINRFCKCVPVAKEACSTQPEVER